MMFTGRFFLFLFGLIFGLSANAQQSNDFRREMDFVNHMLGRQNYNEALFLLENLEPTNPDQQDSLNYLKGWVLYGRKELATSAYFLSQVRPQSSWFAKSSFFAAYNHAYLGNTHQGIELLHRFSNDSPDNVLAMKNFQLAGIALLERKHDDFAALATGFTGAFNVMATEELKLLDYQQRIMEVPYRSPLLAGLMSTAVPGLGKIYAGKSAEGISSLLYVGAMAASSWDFYNRFGGNHPLFIASALLTGVFYVGNIWGSVVAVRRVQNEFNYEMDQRILLDMHIPLRKLFP